MDEPSLFWKQCLEGLASIRSQVSGGFQGPGGRVTAMLGAVSQVHMETGVTRQRTQGLSVPEARTASEPRSRGPEDPALPRCPPERCAREVGKCCLDRARFPGGPSPWLSLQLKRRRCGSGRTTPPATTSRTLFDVGRCHQGADDVIQKKTLKECVRDFRGLAEDEKAAEINTLWSRWRATCPGGVRRAPRSPSRGSGG